MIVVQSHLRQVLSGFMTSPGVQYVLVSLVTDDVSATLKKPSLNELKLWA